MKPLLFLFSLVLIFLLASYLLPAPKKRSHSAVKEKLSAANKAVVFQQLRNKARSAKQFVLQKGLSSHYAFLIDMSLPSGKARFFIYDFTKDTLVSSGLVAHGSCNTTFLQEPRFSNTPQCGCTSIGRYKVRGAYEGRFGKAFKLYGLDSSNGNAFQRNIVLHGYSYIPDDEVYPASISNSLGCPMVSPNFLIKASHILETEARPVLLWIYQ